MNEIKTTLFNDGKGYNLARREYPQELIEDIISISGIKKEGKILDIGCGPGKSTLPFVKRGYEVVGLDPSESMINEARETSKDFSNVEYMHTSFESANLQKRRFDLILFGQSLQRFNQNTIYRDTRNILKDDGNLAAFWGLYGWNQASLLRRVVKIFKSYSEQFPRDWRDIREHIPERMMESPEFNLPRVKYYDLTETFTKEEFVRLAGSFSWTSALSKEEKQKMLERVVDSLSQEEETFKIPITYTLSITYPRHNFIAVS